jgi:hypothetical protein
MSSEFLTRTIFLSIQVINLLTGYLKLSTTDVSKAEMIAYTVDKAVDDLHSFDLDNKAYMGVVRSLAFNLKRNEVRTSPNMGITAHEFFFQKQL